MMPKPSLFVVICCYVTVFASPPRAVSDPPGGMSSGLWPSSPTGVAVRALKGCTSYMMRLVEFWGTALPKVANLTRRDSCLRFTRCKDGMSKKYNFIGHLIKPYLADITDILLISTAYLVLFLRKTAKKKCFWLDTRGNTNGRAAQRAAVTLCWHLLDYPVDNMRRLTCVNGFQFIIFFNIPQF